jgi:hypothetical protein
MTTKTIHTWLDFKGYGIGFLTGESCAYGIRLLFDLNKDGVQIIRNFFGLEFDIDNPTNGFTKNWNSTVNGIPAIASILLPLGIFQELAIFCLFNVNYCYGVFIESDNIIIGCNEDYFERYQNIFGNDKKYKFMRNPNYVHNSDKTKDDKNIHQMSGRTE